MSGIIRAPRPARGWTEIQNDTLRDARLSFRARGVLARLLSNADGFRMTALELAAESPQEGRQAILTAFRELREAGYIVQTRLQGADGRWRTETFVYDIPQSAISTEVRLPDSGSPDAGQPDAGSPDRIRNTIEKEQEKKTVQRSRASRVTPPQMPRAKRGALTSSVSCSAGKKELSAANDGWLVPRVANLILRDSTLRAAVHEARLPAPAALPVGFAVPDAWITSARKTHPDLPVQQLRNAASQFVSYWTATPGRKALKPNWLAAWLNWIE